MLRPIRKLLERNALVIAILLTLFVTYISFVSIKGVNPVSVVNSDKLGHFIAYFVMSSSWFYAFRKHSKILTIMALLITYGIIIEALQDIITTHRQADFFDILANSAGVLLATLLFYKRRGNVNGT